MLFFLGIACGSCERLQRATEWQASSWTSGRAFAEAQHVELPKHSRILRACLPQPLVSKLSESSPCASTVMDFGSSQFPGAMYQPHDQTRPPPKPNPTLRPANNRSSVRSSTFSLFQVVVRLPIRVDFRSRLSSTCHTEPNQQLRSACRQVRQVSQKLSARVVCQVCLVMADVCLPIWLQLGWALRRKRCCVICVSVGGACRSAWLLGQTVRPSVASSKPPPSSAFRSDALCGGRQRIPCRVAFPSRFFLVSERPCSVNPFASQAI